MRTIRKTRVVEKEERKNAMLCRLIGGSIHAKEKKREGMSRLRRMVDIKSIRKGSKTRRRGELEAMR